MNDVKVLGMTMVLVGILMGPALAGTNALAEPTRQGSRSPGTIPAGERKCFRGGLAGELGLSEEKASEIKNMMHETRKTMIRLKAERDLAKAELEHLIAADTLDEKAVTAAADKLAQINSELTKAQVKARLGVNALLTPEQRSRMHELRQGMTQRFKERGEERRGQGRERRMGREDRPEGAPEPEPEAEPF